MISWEELMDDKKRINIQSSWSILQIFFSFEKKSKS
ncbi:Hypothetical protein Minf_0190 [Methylacidiphilum infernorum V4]|uniref:Uncharacterized protein n=1 Tax=Methylacidiphilum infernorum (isolate V4) TaxID=481448 RepID=B3DXL6_METI4|nr:Hypothetical protein Minf_0190 [Methylacidiphilum infernorum V4]